MFVGMAVIGLECVAGTVNEYLLKQGIKFLKIPIIISIFEEPIPKATLFLIVGNFRNCFRNQKLG